MTLPVTDDPRLALLLAHAHQQGVTVHRANLPDTLRGRYDHTTRQILIRDGLTTAQTLAVLAHELVHAQRGHDGPQSPQQEAAVNQAAAALVISTTDYERAENAVGPNPWALAQELGVTPDLIVSWQAWAEANLVR